MRWRQERERNRERRESLKTGVPLTQQENTPPVGTDGTLLAFAYRYLKAEQADGTPFTHRGAAEIRRLGIRTIVLPIAAMIVISALCVAFRLPLNASVDWGNFFSVSMGVVLILVSLIFRYGAELEGKSGESGTSA